MTEQEAFTKVRDHLLRQKEKCIVNGLCAYRGENGKKCAIGALISDEDLTEELNKTPVFYSEVRDLPSLKGLSLVFLTNLQEIHDECPIREWEFELRTFANSYGLNWE